MNTNPPTTPANIPERHADTLRPALYADLDAAGLAAAFAAYSATYNGGWARSVAAAIRAYNAACWLPETEKPPEETEVLAEDIYGSFHVAEWDPNRHWHNGDGGGVSVLRWTRITRQKS